MVTGAPGDRGGAAEVGSPQTPPAATTAASNPPSTTRKASRTGAPLFKDRTGVIAGMGILVHSNQLAELAP